MSNPEELRKKFSLDSLGSTIQQQQQQQQQHQQTTAQQLPQLLSTTSITTTASSIPLPILPQSVAGPSTSVITFPNTLNILEPERTYVFPSITTTGDGNGFGSRGVGDVGVSLISPLGSSSRGHARSVSHGGGTVLGPGGRPLKSAIKGHQRAFSQGQITDSMAPPRSGHSRVGSKTDFILPSGHKETLDNNRERRLIFNPL